MASIKFTNPSDASSYLHPSSGAAYAPLRAAIVTTALAMGYDHDSMTECRIDWAHDQDPYGHVATGVYPRYFAVCNLRVVETFAPLLNDEEKFAGFLSGSGVAAVVKKYEVEYKRPAMYPDSLILANRISEISPHQYYGTTTMWSLRQQKVIAETRGYIVFYDFATNRPVSLLDAGGAYADLYHGLVERVRVSNERAVQWERDHPKKKGVPKL